MIKHLRRTALLVFLLTIAVAQLSFSGVVRAESEEPESTPATNQQRKENQEAIKANREKMKATQESLKTTREEAKEKNKERIEERKEDRCTKAATTTAEQIKKFDGMKSEMNARHAKFLQQLDATIAKLKTEGVSVTQLEADRAELAVLTGALADSLELYLTKIEAAQALAPNCGSAQGEFKLALQAARTQMQVVRTKSQAVRTYALTIQGDLKEARSELQAMKKASPRPRVTAKPGSTPVPTE